MKLIFFVMDSGMMSSSLPIQRAGTSNSMIAGTAVQQ